MGIIPRIFRECKRDLAISYQPSAISRQVSGIGVPSYKGGVGLYLALKWGIIYIEK